MKTFNQKREVRGPRSFSDKKTEMHRAKCYECGVSCEVPFRPTGGKPVYCSNCFAGKEDSGFSPRTSSRSKVSLEDINAKLDLILKVLSPKTNQQKVSSYKKRY
ncbi:MAG: CxxC-x17-CxxC domain-containing protein [Patescibacteria group bacterium]